MPNTQNNSKISKSSTNSNNGNNTMHLQVPPTEIILTSPPSSPLPQDWNLGGNEEDNFQWIEPPPCQDTFPLKKDEKRVLNFKNNKKIVIQLY